jgi:integrase
MAGLIKRGKKYYLVYFEGQNEKRISLQTESHQIAREKKRQFESKMLAGHSSYLPTKTPLPQILDKYVDYISAKKRAKSVQTDVYYLRGMFGPIGRKLEITSLKRSQKAKRPKVPKKSGDGRKNMPRIEVKCLEEITTAQISEFVTEIVRIKGLAAKTANHNIKILRRLFNWAMEEGGVKLPEDKNPANKVQLYKEKASDITFLTQKQITEQLEVLADHVQYQIMVAMLIYAGLRREELLWLTISDVDLNAGQNGMIRVRAKTIEDQSWDPKTGINRAVPISKALRAYLENYNVCPSVGNWYFPSPKGKRYDPDNFSSELRAINSENGLKWSCLDYRHTFGSQLAKAGQSLYKISKLMGNSPEICRKHYAALMPEEMFDVVEFDTPPAHLKYSVKPGKTG